MRQKFSKSWRASKKPKKQRKYRANAPLHLKKKFVKANLSKELRKKLEKRKMQAKKGDSVKIMKGKFKGKTGKILEVKLKESKIIIENINVKKQDGSKVNVKHQPSNLQIIELGEREKTQKKEKPKKEEKEQTKKEKTENKK